MIPRYHFPGPRYHPRGSGKWEGMVRRGETNHGQLARQHDLSRATVSQICSLTLLAPDIQESVLLSSSLSRRCLAAMAARPIWREQRRL